MGWMIRGLSPSRGWEFLFSPRLAGSGAHPASYQMSTRGSFPGGKAARAWKLTTHLHLMPRSKHVELYLYYPNMSSWHAQLRKAQGQLYLYLCYEIKLLSNLIYFPFWYKMLICGKPRNVNKSVNMSTLHKNSCFEILPFCYHIQKQRILTPLVR
jgi:hypothetical protein